MKQPPKSIICLGLLLLPFSGALEARADAADTNGLFAVFDTTMGSFTCRLDMAEAPITTANFTGLAEGSRTWLDLPTGHVRQDPFYDGIAFHRVVSNFVIQAGSPAGTGRDGPGYAIVDEFTTNLNHATIGTLSMANSGLNSGGSQFFITLRPTPELDFDKQPLSSAHAVFGLVESGLDVVEDIGKMVLDGDSKPVTNVVIESVQIVRCGPEAEAFDVHAQHLPVVGGSNAVLRLSAEREPELVLSRLPYRDYSLYYANNLNSTWTNSNLGYLDGTSNHTPVALAQWTGSGPGMFHVPMVDYLGSTYGLPAVSNYQFQLDIESGQTLFLDFTSSGSGSYILDEGTTNALAGDITGSVWSAPNYAIVSFDRLSPSIWRFRFDFSPQVTNAFSMTGYPYYPNTTSQFELLGVFTQPPPP